ncbi:MAG: hypothetical protein EOO50_07930 [Flavobacterium sp.]|uniref:hypothetical protein n=1 Tax=Flavobacterium sp. TaxID=239 RepID=UPI0012128683|nr:hypothetical protein [Flavobacterium sp.]RZJ66807.1 MAG: hypothetical protein EOO50_07930 [Flavobacterium sp.]
MKRLLLLLAVFAAGLCHAQKDKKLSSDYEYKVGEPYKVIDADDKYYMSVDGKVIAIKIRKRDIFVQRFDVDKPSQISVKEYEDAFPKNAVYERMEIVKGKVMLFFTQWNGDDEIEQLFVQEIDVDKGEFKGEAKRILQVKGRVVGSGSGRMMDFNLTDKFPIYTSFDKSNFLVQYEKRLDKKDKQDDGYHEKYGLVAFDGDLNQLSAREVEMPYSKKQMDNLDFQLDNSGNVYVLNKVFEDDSHKEKKKKGDDVAPNYHIELFTLKPGSDQFKISKVESQQFFINQLVIYDGPKGEIVAAGFYNKNLAKGGFFSKGEYAGFDSRANCDGLVTFKMKPDGTFGDMRSYEIPVELLNQNESKKTIRKNAKKEEDGESAKFTDLHARGIEIQDDGSVIFLAEQYYVKVHTTAGGPNMPSRTYYTYHYNEILIAKLLANGTLGWMKKIPKQQVGTQGRGSMSFKHYEAGSDHFLVFFDNPDNVEIPADEVPKGYSDRKKGYLTAVRVADADGSTSRGSIINVKEADDFKLHQLSTNRIIKVNDNTFLMEAYKKGKEDVMVKVILK